MRRLLAAPLSALLLLAGCGGGTEIDDAAGTESSSTSSSSAAPTSTSAPELTGQDTEADGASDAPPFPANTDPDTGEAQPGDGPTVVTALRIGGHDGFDRVVFEVSGSAVPGWDVAYTDAPTQAGSGKPIDVPGAAFLRVSLTGITNPYEAPDVDELDRGTVTSQTPVVAGVGYDSVFEGQALAYVGVAAQTPFRVYALSNPSRVVVEVTA